VPFRIYSNPSIVHSEEKRNSVFPPCPPCSPCWRDKFLRAAAGVGLIAALSISVTAQKPQPKPPAAKVQPKQEQRVPFRVGEKLEFDVGWSSYVTAGTATVTVQDKKPSYESIAYYIAAEGRPTTLLSKLYTLYYRVDTLLDAYSLLPQRGAVYSEEGRRRRMKVTLFDHAARKASYEVQTATLVKKELRLPAYTQDGLSALYTLRSIALTPGDTFNMPVADNGTVYTVQMTVGKVEPIKSGLGEIQAVKVTPLIKAATGDMPGRGLAIWISSDARRLPLRIEAQLLVGKFTLVLRQASGV
jgi:uncharacterized protein DUF3108